MRYFYIICIFLSLIACNSRQSTYFSTSNPVIEANDVDKRNEEINDSLSQQVVPLSFKELVLGDSYSKCIRAAERSKNFRKQWDNIHDRYEYVTSLLGVDVFVTIEQFQDTIYEIKLNSSKWDGYSLDTLYKSQYGITGYDDIPASENKAGWGVQRDTKWVFKNGIVEINHIYSDGRFRGAYVYYTDRRHIEKKNNAYLKPEYIKDSIAVAKKEKSQANRLKLYIISDSSNYNELESYLQENIFLKRTLSYQRDADIDTTSTFNGEDKSRVILDYSPKSKVVSRYSYLWDYDPTIIDEYSTENPKYNQGYSNYYLIKSGGYFMNIFEKIRKEYGEPTSVMIDKENDYITKRTFVTEKAKIDTLQLTKLINTPCHFEVCWDNSERKVALKYYNYDRTDYNPKSSIEYEYINKYNLAVRQDEIDSIYLKKQITLICFFTFFIILAIVAVILIVKKAYENAKAKKEEEKERMREKEERQKLYEKEKEEKEKQRLHQLEELKTRYNNYVASLEDKYGNCDKCIRLYTDNEDEIYEIRAFSQSKHIVIGEKEFSFEDIIDYMVNDDLKETETVRTFRGASSATTKTNPGSMIGRSVAGGLLLGGAGAIIGGSTASKKTTIQHGPDTSVYKKEIEHNYTIAITVKDIANPVIYLNVGGDTTLKDEIVGLIKVVMSMK